MNLEGHMPSEAAAISESPPLADISREELRRRLYDPSLAIVDVLPRSLFEMQHIPGAINLPLADIQKAAVNLLPDPSAEIAVYCAKFT
jgi:ArsR family transcriptional regulator